MAIHSKEIIDSTVVNTVLNRRKIGEEQLNTLNETSPLQKILRKTTIQHLMFIARKSFQRRNESQTAEPGLCLSNSRISPIQLSGVQKADLIKCLSNSYSQTTLQSIVVLLFLMRLSSFNSWNRAQLKLLNITFMFLPLTRQDSWKQSRKWT